MNFALSDEQIFLQEAARNALGRVKTVEAARTALEDPSALPDLWPTATEAGWSGLLIAEEHGGAGLGALDAMLVAAECGRVLAGTPLLGHVPATAVLSAASDADADLLARLASGEVRAAFVGAMPPGDLDEGWTVEPRSGARRAPAPSLEGGALSGAAHWVPDAAGADVLVVATSDGGAVVVDPSAAGVTIEDGAVYDATRSLGHVTFDGAAVTALDVDAAAVASAWHLGQSLIAAESLGAVEECLERSVQYAKERFTFGRAIGSYQAVKHGLVEVLRLMENSRSLLYYAGWAQASKPDEWALAASAARVSAGHALDYAARELISVHGGIGATWEHDAPLFFRRAQLSRRLLGGAGAAADRVAGELLAAARAA